MRSCDQGGSDKIACEDLQLVQWRFLTTLPCLLYKASGVKEGGKIHVMYWTLGRHDAVIIVEGLDRIGLSLGFN